MINNVHLSSAAAELARIVAEKIETDQWISVQAITGQWDYVKFPDNALELAINELAFSEHVEHRNVLGEDEILIRRW